MIARGVGAAGENPGRDPVTNERVDHFRHVASHRASDHLGSAQGDLLLELCGVPFRIIGVLGQAHADERASHLLESTHSEPNREPSSICRSAVTLISWPSAISW